MDFVIWVNGQGPVLVGGDVGRYATDCGHDHMHQRIPSECGQEARGVYQPDAVPAPGNV